MSAETHHKAFGEFLETLVTHYKPPAERVAVLSAPMEGRPDHLAYQITGLTAEDVQREIDRIMSDVDVRGGAAEFRSPARSREPEYFGRWQSRGYTRISSATAEVA